VGASGIAAPEAFLNGKRAHLAQAGKSETEIFEMLRPGGIKKKVKKWPDDLLTAPFTISLLFWSMINSFPSQCRAWGSRCLQQPGLPARLGEINSSAPLTAADRSETPCGRSTL
jgi:hypothetical protein